MKSPRRGQALRKLLDLCDDLQRIRTKLTEPGLRRDSRERLRRQALTKTDQLARDLACYRFKGPLGQLLREFKFEPVHFQVLATLLQHHLRSATPGLDGRAILAAIFDNSFEVLRGMELLDENAPLRASGLIVLEDDEDCPEDVLEARFRISEDALIAFQGEIAGLVIEDQRGGRNLPYRSNRDYLVDLRILHNLYRHRSERVFQQDRWDRIHPGVLAPGGYLTKRIESFSRRIQRRLAASPKAAEFPAVRLLQELKLTPEEIIVVVHLLFLELYEGNAYADAAELIRIISADEVELIRNRRLLQANAPLVAKEVVHVEPLVEGREMTGEICLNDWVVNTLFGALPPDGSIHADEQLDWHVYLKNLEDTQSFFRDLDSN